MTSSSLSKTTIILHWTVAILFITAMCTGIIVDGMERGPEATELRNFHKSIGLLVIAFAAYRVVWRIKEGHIPAIPGMPKWQAISATLMHYLLLTATILMPLTGILMSRAGGRAIEFFGFVVIEGGDKYEWLVDITKPIHYGVTWFLVAVVALHIVAALKHQLIDKDNTLGRMLGMKKK